MAHQLQDLPNLRQIINIPLKFGEIRTVRTKSVTGTNYAWTNVTCTIVICQGWSDILTRGDSKLLVEINQIHIALLLKACLTKLNIKQLSQS